MNPQVEELLEWVKTQQQVHVDESPWLVKGVKEWMWTICGEGYSLFHAGDTRSRAERSLRLAVTKRKVSGGSRSVVDFFQQALSLTRTTYSTSLSLIPQPN